jgi:release factor glutamine methyltransferase
MAEVEPHTWRGILMLAEDALAAGPGDARTEARWMTEELSGYRGAELLTNLGDAAPRIVVARLHALIERRLAGEPLQYVLGSWQFRQLDLAVDRRVLIPRPETEVVAGVALDELDRIRVGAPARSLVAVDLGTGSGAIGLSLAFERSWVEVTLTDVSSDALDVARANLAGIGRPGSRVRLVEGAWFSAMADAWRGEIDLVVSNPPYIAEHERADLPAEVRDWEPIGALIAGPTGTEALEHLVTEAIGWLAPAGALVLELAPHQAEAMRALATDVGYASVAVIADDTGRDRALVARR